MAIYSSKPWVNSVQQSPQTNILHDQYPFVVLQLSLQKAKKQTKLKYTTARAAKLNKETKVKMLGTISKDTWAPTWIGSSGNPIFESLWWSKMAWATRAWPVRFAGRSGANDQTALGALISVFWVEGNQGHDTNQVVFASMLVVN